MLRRGFGAGILIAALQCGSDCFGELCPDPCLRGHEQFSAFWDGIFNSVFLVIPFPGWD